jgi:hypothetical protein
LTQNKEFGTFGFQAGVLSRHILPLFCSRTVSGKITVMPTSFDLRFGLGEIDQWESGYNYGNGKYDPLEEKIINEISVRAKTGGFLERDDFLEICRWKTRRTQKRCQKNDAEFIKAITSTAFSTTNERLRIQVLTLLHGVKWPTASVILHFCSHDRYPIVDFRALWSLRSAEPAAGYNFEFWWDYTIYCRAQAEKANVSMRKFDRALWQYSAKNQSLNAE